MLRELAVQNLAVIEDVRVELQAGFCVWTGETGAGKSLLLGALGLLLGERGSVDLIRKDTDERASPGDSVSPARNKKRPRKRSSTIRCPKTKSSSRGGSRDRGEALPS
jgi:energy-coupling factor transporter ATP-binding protein EcfA2